MKKISVLIFLAFSFSVFPEPSEAQNAEISGTVFMPAVQSKARVSRGKAYRGRLTSGKKAGSSGSSAKSSFEDVIVSAQPISFKASIKPLSNPKMYQKGATFIPRVLPVTRGSVVQFINQDKFYHNVFSLTPGSKFNIGRKPKGSVVYKKIPKTGEVKLFCDIHTQMNAIILSLDTPYFTRVGAGGKYSIKSLPAGKYRIEVYHPDLNPASETIEIGAGEKLLRNFNLAN